MNCSTGLKRVKSCIFPISNSVDDYGDNDKDVDD